MFRKSLSILLLCLSLAVSVQAASPYGRFHALVIGNQNYKYLKPLKTPVADAEAVAKVLEDQYGFEVELLLDRTWKQTMKAVSALRVTANREGDNLLIYYAGHGYLNKKTGVEYWQPVDSERDNDIYWIPTSRITSMLKEIQAKHVLVVADSCYSGSLLTRDSGAKLPDGTGLDELLRRMQARRSRTALTSGGEEPVWDSGGGNHSVFAKAFLDVLRENRKILDGYTIFDEIRRPVALNAPQTPQYGDIRMTGHEWGDFLLVPKILQNIAVGELEEKKSFPSFAIKGESEQRRAPQQGDTMTDSTTGMEFVYVPKGCFMMGSPADEEGREDDEGPVHEVCVDGFWMGKYEVTQGQWGGIMDINPAYFRTKGDEYPVEQVAWEDTEKFLAKLNRKSRKIYRLPTEAEWEYACRANGSGKYCSGDDLDVSDWYRQNSGGSTHPVGGKKANSFGLYDMSGNVLEWCADWYGKDYYATRLKNNPQGPDMGTYRVLRGGGWFHEPLHCRSGSRYRNPPEYRYRSVGFRIAFSFQAAGS